MTTWRGPRERGRTSRWGRADPRLLLGGLLVLGAAVLGSWAVAAADERVAYWSLTEDVVLGDPVTEDQLEQTLAVLDADAAARALRTDEDLPAALADLRWSADASAGTLLDRDHLAPASTGVVVELPLAVAAGAAPDDLRRGEVVDVWVGPGPGDEPGVEAVRVLQDVRVVSAGGGAARAESGSLSRTVVVDVGAVPLVGDVVANVAAGHVTLVRRS